MKYIKLRAWTGNNMLFRELDDRNWYDSIKREAKTIISTSTSDSNKFKIMLFSGVKDKNGIEIYDEDIVSDYNNKVQSKTVESLSKDQKEIYTYLLKDNLTIKQIEREEKETLQGVILDLCHLDKQNYERTVLLLNKR